MKAIVVGIIASLGIFAYSLTPVTVEKPRTPAPHTEAEGESHPSAIVAEVFGYKRDKLLCIPPLVKGISTGEFFQRKDGSIGIVGESSAERCEVPILGKQEGAPVIAAHYYIYRCAMRDSLKRLGYIGPCRFGEGNRLMPDTVRIALSSTDVARLSKNIETVLSML